MRESQNSRRNRQSEKKRTQLSTTTNAQHNVRSITEIIKNLNVKCTENRKIYCISSVWAICVRLVCDQLLVFNLISAWGHRCTQYTSHFAKLCLHVRPTSNFRFGLCISFHSFIHSSFLHFRRTIWWCDSFAICSKIVNRLIYTHQFLLLMRALYL